VKTGYRRESKISEVAVSSKEREEVPSSRDVAGFYVKPPVGEDGGDKSWRYSLSVVDASGRLFFTRRKALL